MVNITSLFYRVFLFLMILSLTVFISLRVNKYPRNLRLLMMLAAVFSAIGTLGRLVDVLVLFIHIPFSNEIHVITHIISIGGLIWIFISMMKTLESYYIPLTSIGTSEEKRKPPGTAYLVLSSEITQEIAKLMRNLKGPVLIFTRHPHLYNKSNNVKIVWITTADSKGVSPTALHVLQDIAIRFTSENNGTTVIIDCLEYLIIYNGFRGVFKFLVSLKDYLMIKGATLILFVDPMTLKESEVALLRREFHHS
ncbi:DUF835 domain-containing protein [Thermococcus sp. M39]|uniref:DUF835 domain-containing protein n=1 Tax=Thermococcus sp. M39 TaxID=1638262 RepID=UPI00143AF20B|nr:DUF835 domain-containing protein [Thermococcus sp. M39]NJE08330.1 DUF835 domain-containing protein [Thermococcus sp. M39]